MSDKTHSGSTIYTADWIVTQDDDRAIFHDGALYVRDGLVADVGPAADVLRRHPGEKTDALGEAAIFPGLVDAHCHLPMSPLRGLGDDKPLQAWLQEDIFPREARLTPEIVRLGALLSCCELLRTGTTAFFDMYMLEENVFAAADQAGLRGVLGENAVRFFPQLGGASKEALFERVAANAEAWRGHPRLKAAICPHAPYTTDPALLRECLECSRSLGIPLGMHLAETEGETETCLREHGLRPVEYCRKLGLLGPNSTFFHCVHITPEEIGELRDSGAGVVHNPASNMKLASGACPAAAMLEAGLELALGTDGAASNNQQNMVRETWIAALLGKATSGNPAAMTAQKALDMATRNGARALHIDRIGSLRPGWHADFFALDLRTAPNLRPCHDPVSTLAYAATGHETRLVAVGGRELYRDGRFLTIDYPALLEETEKLERWARAR